MILKNPNTNFGNCKVHAKLMPELFIIELMSNRKARWGVLYFSASGFNSSKKQFNDNPINLDCQEFSQKIFSTLLYFSFKNVSIEKCFDSFHYRANF